jgi:hypothetical protein
VVSGCVSGLEHGLELDAAAGAVVSKCGHYDMTEKVHSPAAAHAVAD